jgi:uncharacterized membrane protein
VDVTDIVDSMGLSAKKWAIIIWGLYLAAYALSPLVAVVGLCLAYVKRADLAGTPYESHATSAIRTFWISLLSGVIGAVLLIVGVGFVILGLLVIWNIFRIVRGLVSAIDGKAIVNPKGWL